MAAILRAPGLGGVWGTVRGLATAVRQAEPATAGLDAKQMNLCSAVNDALHIAMDENPK